MHFDPRSVSLDPTRPRASPSGPTGTRWKAQRRSPSGLQERRERERSSGGLLRFTDLRQPRFRTDAEVYACQKEDRKPDESGRKSEPEEVSGGRGRSWGQIRTCPEIEDREDRGFECYEDRRRRDEVEREGSKVRAMTAIEEQRQDHRASREKCQRGKRLKRPVECHGGTISHRAVLRSPVPLQRCPARD